MRTTLALAALVFLAACSDTRDSAEVYSGRFKENPWVYLFVDPETKCEYLANSNTSSLTPRYGRDGKQICRGN